MPKAKTERLTKKPRRIHLNAAATEVLRSLPKILGNPHIIVGQREGEHMASLAAPWARVCGRAGIAGCRIHDLRHTFASFAAADGLSLPMIGRLLGHTVPATTARYAHLAEDALRRANETLGGRLADLVKAGEGRR